MNNNVKITPVNQVFAITNTYYSDRNARTMT